MTETKAPNPMYPAAAVEASPAEAKSIPPANAFRSWLCGTLLLIAAASGAFVFANVKMDLQGLHGNNDVRVHTLSRFSVYLMAYRYIPDNFDGLLIGNSVATGYPTSKIHSYRVFNTSMRGALMREQRAVAEEVLKRGHLKMALLVLNPSLTSQLDVRSAYMTPHDYTSSFGSLQTLMVDFQALREHFGHPGTFVYDAYGRTIWTVGMVPWGLEKVSAKSFVLDPAATKDLYELLAELHAKRVKVYVFFSPAYRPMWEVHQKLLKDWEAKVLAGFSPEDTVIRLPDEVLNSIETKRENFPDYWHPTGSVDAAVMDLVAESIDAGLTGQAGAYQTPGTSR